MPKEISSNKRGRAPATAAAALTITLLAVHGSAAWSQEIDTAAVERAVKAVLQSRPELVRDALQALEAREAQDRLKAAQAALADNAVALASVEASVQLGNPQGDVVIYEFIDYRCGYCKRLSSTLDELVKRDANVKVVAKHTPILGSESIQAAMLMTEARKKLGDLSLARLHREVMDTPEITGAVLDDFRQRFGLSAPTVAQREAAALELDQVRDLSNRLGMTGTPMIVIGREIFYGAIPLEQVMAAVKEARLQRASR